VDNNLLDSNINTHGGGGTNIPSGFILMDKILSTYSLNIDVTILFISDGQDNNINTLETRMRELKGNCGRRVSLICLGILKNFPTFLSMNLREFYHNGDNSIPAV